MENIRKNQTTQRALKTGTNNYMAETVDWDEEIRKQETKEYQRLSNILEEEKQITFKKADCKNDTEKKHKKSFENFCRNFEEIKEIGLGIFMYGDCGTGKSYYSVCIMNELNKEYKVYRTSLFDLLEEIRQTYKKYTDATDEYLFKRLKKSDLVIFDDLGNEMITDWGKEKMFLIFEFLYKNRVSFIINTNLDNKQFQEFLRINGSPKLFDRIRERCKSYKFDWDSRRKDLHKADFERLF